MNNLAIINCKSKKQDYSCSAEEMYSKSFQFRSQITFIKQYYKNYLILSSKYGLIEPSKIIEPYEISLSKGSRLKKTNQLKNNEIEIWSNNVINQLKELSIIYDIIDLHISNPYLNPIKIILNDKIKHIKQPSNPGLVKNRYDELLNDLNNKEKIDLKKIGEIRKSKNPEIERWWYHKEYNSFFGYANIYVKNILL